MISLGLNILHCPSNVVVVMTIWKWSLFQTNLDGYSLRPFFIPYNENHSYDILGARMLWKPKEARILKNFIDQPV
jgi:hypothetical protein